MNLQHLLGNFEKRKLKNNLSFELKGSATQEQIRAAEERLNVKFPDQVKLFYSFYNGLSVHNPPIEILRIEDLNWLKTYIHFSTIDERIKIWEVLHKNPPYNMFV